MNEQPKQFKWVGTRTIRPDGVDKVTGRAMYVADLPLPGLLQGNVARSPPATASITSIAPNPVVQGEMLEGTVLDEVIFHEDWENGQGN